ncbi:MAG: DUF1624 domain-containing protein [Asgard group archaeon]|nr:DUF1624 domain-containing protein [Asgard group archaeon]
MEKTHPNTSTGLSENTSVKRFASLDFLRGLAIFVMIILHIISDYLDIDTLLAGDNINHIPLINLIALVILPLLGGLAGLFLLASAISNMVSMQKNLKKGISAGSIAIKQVIGGIILLLFAMLTEGLTGYHGSFGNLISNLRNPTFNISIAMTGWATFETIHTIAWCVILNGITQGLLSIKSGWKKPRRQILIYAILSVIILASTKFVWDGIYNGLKGVNGIGFPWGINTDGSRMDLPDLRTAGFVAVLIGIFINPLAAPMEPIFPYLAVSFIGSIIGIAISQPKKVLFKGFTKTILLTGFVMFVAGAIGTVIELVNVMNNTGFDGGITFYRFISFHRHWYPDAPMIYAPYISSFAWLWQTLITNGFSIMLCMIVIFLVEFRGRGSHFAKKTGYIRRYGIIAFSNYNNQWLNWLPPLFIPLLFGLTNGSKMLWGGTILSILTTLAFYTIILYLWGMVNYKFSFEWFMKSIGYILLPIRRISFLKEKKWYQKGDINMDVFSNKGAWINIVEENEAYHKAKTDSKISMILSICCLAIPIFFAFSVVTLPMSIKARKKEGINKKNTIALVLSIIGAVITVAFFAFAFVFTPASLNFYL